MEGLEVSFPNDTYCEHGLVLKILLRRRNVVH
jgi:hypothetical protein